MYILWEASSEAVCHFFFSEGWNVDEIAGFGAAVSDLEVETDENGRLIIGLCERNELLFKAWLFLTAQIHFSYSYAGGNRSFCCQ